MSEQRIKRKITVDALNDNPARAYIGSADQKRKEEPARDKIHVSIDSELANRLRNATFYTPEMTMYQIVEEGLESVLARMEEQRGGPFPQRPSELKGGRPVR